MQIGNSAVGKAFGRVEVEAQTSNIKTGWQGAEFSNVAPTDADEYLEDSRDSVFDEVEDSRDLRSIFDQRLAHLRSGTIQTRTEQLHTWFNVAMGIVMLLNCVVIALETDLAPRDADGPVKVKDKLLWFCLESLFCIVFLLEVAWRIHWGGISWLRKWLNLIDVILILCMVVDTWLMPFFAESMKGLSLLSMLRILRMLRLMRLLRIMRSAKGLYTLLMGFGEAIASLGWVCVIMLSGLFFVAIVTTNFIGHSSEFQDLQLGDVSVQEKFGTVPKSMYSLFELMTLEGWHEVGRPLVMRQPLMFLFLFGFIMFFTFGLLNMIVAVVVQKTIEQTRQANCRSEQEEKMRMVQEILHMKTVFERTDTDESGCISLTEFTTAIQSDATVRECFKKLRLPVHDAHELYLILDANGDERVHVKEFLEGVAKVQGATSIHWDIIAANAKVRSLHTQMKSLRDEMSSREAKDIAWRAEQSALQTKLCNLVEAQSLRIEVLASTVDEIHRKMKGNEIVSTKS